MKFTFAHDQALVERAWHDYLDTLQEDEFTTPEVIRRDRESALYTIRKVVNHQKWLDGKITTATYTRGSRNV